MKIVRRASFTPVPWKNGGGVTHEALRMTGAAAQGEPFRWRVSIADLAASGPFSDFSGYHRTLVLLRGDGVRLCFAGGEERLLCNAGDLAEFDGGLATRCDLLNGACSDLNLMVSTSLRRPHAWVESLSAPREVSRTPYLTLVFPIAGAVSMSRGDAGPVRLGEWDLAVLSPDDGGLIRPASAAACLVFFATLEDNLA